MQISAWLKVEGRETGSKYRPIEPGKVTLTRKKPDTGAQEVAIKIEIEVPDALFLRPTLTAKIAVPEDAPISTEVPVEVQDNLAALLSEQMGVQIHVSTESN